MTDVLERRIQDIHDRLHYQETRLESLEGERQDFRSATAEMRKAREELSSASRELGALAERLDGSKSHASEQIGALWGQFRELDGRLRGVEQQVPVVLKTSERNESHADRLSDSARRLWTSAIAGFLSGVGVMIAGYLLMGVGGS